MLCIFNPEHDLCLANGNRHFVPPVSALRFAQEGASMMQVLYPGSVAVDAAQAGSAYKEALASSGEEGELQIVPWGWNIALKTQLLKVGIPESLMPNDETLALWRKLQHRSTLLSLQPQSRAVTIPVEVEEMVKEYGEVVMKAPWSSSGRGLRWVRGTLGEHDIHWMQKMVREQGSVIAEPRRRVAGDFAFEYMLKGGSMTFVGYSLFKSEMGVYRSNLLLKDEEISQRMGVMESLKTRLEDWLSMQIAPYYDGPLGVDCIRSEEGRVFVSEINLRHTMGLVAHGYLQLHPEAEGKELELKDNRLQVAAGL